MAAELAKHEKVCIWSGNGVKMAQCGSLVLDLAETLNAPVVTTFNGIGSVATSHPLVLGARTRHGTTITRAALEEADCVLVLGSSLSGVATNRWGLQLKHVVQIDFDSTNLGHQYNLAAGLVGELAATLPLLTAAVAKVGDAQKTWTSDILARFTEWKAHVFSGSVNDETASPASPVAVMRLLDEQLLDDEIVCVDAGNPGAWSHLLRQTANSRYMKPVNFGNMGFAIPAGLACGLAKPEKEVLCIIGDGSLGMTLGDLESIGRFTSNVIVVVLNDHAYGNIKQEELFKFGEGHYTGVDLPKHIEYAQVAKALGMGGETIHAAKDIPTAFANARAYNGSYMIEIDFDGSYTIWPEAFLWNQQ